MVLGGWKFDKQESLVKLHFFDNENVLPKFEVLIYSSLKFCVKIFGRDLVQSHAAYKQNEQCVGFLGNVMFLTLWRAIRYVVVFPN